MRTFNPDAKRELPNGAVTLIRDLTHGLECARRLVGHVAAKFATALKITWAPIYPVRASSFGVAMGLAPWLLLSNIARAEDASGKAALFDTLLRSGTLPFEFKVNIYRTSASGLGPYIGTITARNTMITIGGREEPALLLKANLINLVPGPHAFHIHENADCGPKEKDGAMVPGLAAGAHLFAEHHAGNDKVTYKSHLGNLPNLIVDPDGVSTEEVVAPRLALADLVNRSIMVHASQDDNSGRAACGIFK
jgi:superoxide dismutase, Cu-Zn family